MAPGLGHPRGIGVEDMHQEGRFARESDGLPNMASCLTLITGPSKTGDIELKLVTGVHGPGEVHVIVFDTASQAA